MSAPVQTTSCGCPPACPNPTVENIPGPQGLPGINAFSNTDSSTGGFTMPAVNSTVIVHIDPTTSADWMATNQVVFISTAGYFSVSAVLLATQVLLVNLGYSGNASPTTVIAAGLPVSPAGIQGTPGTLNSISPTTTKGDLIVDNGANNPSASDVRLGVGTNGQILTADSGQSTGVGWKAVDLTGAATSLSGQLPIGNGGTGKSTQQAALNALAPSSPASGDLLYFNGTNWVRLPIGTKFQVLRTNSGANGAEWAGQGPIQMVSTSYTTYSTVSTTFSFADSVPTTSGGTQIMSASVTPTNTSSRFLIRGQIPISTSSNNAIAALFTTVGGANAVFACQTPNSGTLDFTFIYTPATTSAQTIALRVGASSGSIYVNGNSSNRLFGGVSAAWMTIEEYA